MSYEERIALARQEIQQILNRHRVCIRAEPEDYGGFASIWLGTDTREPHWMYVDSATPDIKVIDEQWNPE